MVNRVKRNCTEDSEFVRAKSEYSNHLLRASYNISGIDNAFQNDQLLFKETLVRKTKENQVNVANNPSEQKCITSFINEIHKIIRKGLRSAVDSSEQLKEILPLDTIKLSSRRDRNLKDMLAPSVTYADRKDKQLNQLDSCSKLGEVSESMDRQGCAILALEIVPKNLIFTKKSYPKIYFTRLYACYFRKENYASLIYQVEMASSLWQVAKIN